MSRDTKPGSQTEVYSRRLRRCYHPTLYNICVVFTVQCPLGISQYLQWSCCISFNITKQLQQCSVWYENKLLRHVLWFRFNEVAAIAVWPKAKTALYHVSGTGKAWDSVYDSLPWHRNDTHCTSGRGAKREQAHANSVLSMCMYVCMRAHMPLCVQGSAERAVILA